MKKALFYLVIMALSVSCREPKTPRVQSIAKDAYVYAYPMVQQYKIMYAHAIDAKGSSYKAPLNQLSFNYMNDTTVYGEAWVDLRENGFVLHLPNINEECDITVEMRDLFSYNYFSIKEKEGYNGADFLLLGRNRNVVIPANVIKATPAETDFVCVIIKLSASNGKINLKNITDKIDLKPMYIGGTNVASRVDFPPCEIEVGNTRFYGYVNFLLQFCNINPSEAPLMKRFVEIGIVPGHPFSGKTHSKTEQAEIYQGMMAGERVADSLYNSDNTYAMQEHVTTMDDVMEVSNSVGARNEDGSKESCPSL